MELFKVWSTFDLKGNALEKMEKFSVLTKLATERSAILNKELKSLATGFATVNLNAAGAIPELSKLSTLLVRLNVNSGGARERFMALDRTMDSVGLRTQSLIGGTEKLAANLNYVAVTGDRAAASLASIRSIGMTNSIRASGAGVAVRGSHSGNGHFVREGLRPLGSEASAMGGAFIAGGAPLLAVAGTGFMLKEGFDAQKEFYQQVQQLRGGGLTDAQVQEAINIAYTPTKGISTIGKIKSLNDAFMASRNWQEAKILAPALAEAEFAGNATFKNMTDQQRQFLVKFAEMRAGSDMSQIAPAMDLGFRLMNASAGTLDPRQQAQFMKQAATVAYHLSDRGYAGLEPIMQEISGTRTGTAFQTGYQMMATGAGTLNNKKRVEDLLSLGIYKGGQQDKNGRYVSTKMDPALLNLYETDPVSFTKKIIGIYKEHGTASEDDINRRLALDFPRLTSQMMSLVMKNMGKIDRQLDLFDKQPGIHKSFLQALNIPTGVSERLSNAWSSMTTALGALSSPKVVLGMNYLSTFLEKIASALGLISKGEYGQFFSKAFSNTIHSSVGQAMISPLGFVVKKGIDMFSSPPLSSQKVSPMSYGDNIRPEQRASYGDIPMASSPYGITVVHTNVHLDGKQMATVVTKHQASSLHGGGVSRGPAYADPGFTPMSTNLIRVGG